MVLLGGGKIDKI